MGRRCPDIAISDLDSRLSSMMSEAMLSSLQCERIHSACGGNAGVQDAESTTVLYGGGEARFVEGQRSHSCPPSER